MLNYGFSQSLRMVVVALTTVVLSALQTACDGPPPCDTPDPTAERIRFEIVETIDEIRATVRITGIVRNNGLSDFRSTPGKQRIELLEGENRVAVQNFVNFSAGAEIRISFERIWQAGSIYSCELAPTYTLRIAYDPDIFIDANGANDDCRDFNNIITRSGRAINNLFEWGCLDQPSSGNCLTNDECSDGIFCNGNEICNPDGVCARAGWAGNCNDGIACTVDVCSEPLRRCVSSAPDNDGDGHGDLTCMNDEGDPLGDDCDDNDPNRFPGNLELCDELHHDEDCDPTTGAAVDVDGDGYFDGRCCNTTAEGQLICGEDCDDTNPLIKPDGSFRCDPERGKSAVQICGSNGSFRNSFCTEGGVCAPQPNGTGICLPAP